MSTNDKLAQAHHQLLDQVQALIDSQDWREFLGIASRFHRYSANNVLLILAQRPEATRGGLSVYNRMCSSAYDSTCRSKYSLMCRSAPAGSTN